MATMQPPGGSTVILWLTVIVALATIALAIAVY